ncbi:membrane protein insertase YidC [Sphingomicrobium clamense]|uniref:Membrane protein insertase YidC n=1 Tax=Sphingomicrobium clamense TaxID=2851013 RepID=A0ABS6V5P1_9SPHN|nr:membrane protein insertase YidC [Sphingomicrobium sp. B8]MBW0144884.1 membrane protein insertase YidC [Sphingomicrobium sp. B8]
MTDNRNMILAIVLSAIVLIGWSILFPTSGPETTVVEDAEVEAVAVPEADPGPDSPQALRELNEVLVEGGRVDIETPNLSGSINLAGARIDDLTLTNHKQDMREDSPPVRLFTPAGVENSYFAQFGWAGEGIETPGADTVWSASSDTLTPGNPVTLSWSNETGQTFELEIAIDEGYLFTVDQRVVNRGDGAVGFSPYALASRGFGQGEETFGFIHLGPMGVFNDEADYDIDWDDLDEAGTAGETRDSTGGWVGFTDKYWLTALIPSSGERVEASLRKGQRPGTYQAQYVGQQQILNSGRQLTTTTRLFAGAKEKDWLDNYEDAGVPRLSKAIDWGWFEWFMRPIFALLLVLFKMVGNFGVAILILTFLVRFALFPLANKQFKSMAGMRRIQPKLKALQDRYKDDKPRLQQEMLKMYQAEKINPAAGCLPILLQIPIFYALYKVLMVSVEMRHQPFFGWLQDLSAPDPLTPVNLFGLLDFTPPGFLAIGILPILLGITMWLQFKLNPAPMDETQKTIFGIMPWVLMVIMAPFAAGLQLYWVTSNILTMAQQKWFYHRYDMQHAGDTVVEAKAKKS